MLQIINNLFKNRPIIIKPNKVDRVPPINNLSEGNIEGKLWPRGLGTKYQWARLP